jgi:hypothetical protein
MDRFSIVKPIVIADSGLLSKTNINALTERGFEFILGARLKNEKRVLIDKILDFSFKDGEVKTLKNDEGLIVHVGYSEKRAKKDIFNRERGIKKLKKNILSGRLTKSNINNRGYNKFLKMEGKIAISIDNNKLIEDQKWDGLKGYITNTSLSSIEVLDNYSNLWKIEKAFRISKTDLKIRPVYHRLRQRVEAHICISFMAYLVYKELERIIKENNSCQFSINQAIDQINKMYELKVENPNMQPIRLKNNDIQNQILSAVNHNL